MEWQNGSTMSNVLDMAGVSDVMDWFGEWPSFHDAEVTRIHINRSGPSYMDVHAFRMTSEVTPTGHYRCDKHAVVTFEFEDIAEMELYDFNFQNVISGLTFVRTEESLLKVTLHACYGAHGFVMAKKISMSLAPNAPSDSQFRKLDGYEDV
jgi:hypothetical protein